MTSKVICEASIDKLGINDERTSVKVGEIVQNYVYGYGLEETRLRTESQDAIAFVVQSVPAKPSCEASMDCLAWSARKNACFGLFDGYHSRLDLLRQLYRGDPMRKLHYRSVRRTSSISITVNSSGSIN